MFDREYQHITFSGHAARQMLRRSISRDEVITIIKSGDIINDYPDDTPYPSCLILGFTKQSPIHVVLAMDHSTQTGIVITAYIPDLKLWSEDFKTRRPEQ